MSVAARPTRPPQPRPARGGAEPRPVRQGDQGRPGRPGGRGGQSGRDGQRGPRRQTAAGRPRVRPVPAIVPVGFGVLWAVVLLAALATSSLLTVVVLVPVAALATATGLRATEPRRRRRAKSRRPSTLLLVALAASVLDPLVALGGPLLALAVLVVSGGAIAVLVLISGFSASARPMRLVAARFVASYAPALAVTSVVAARSQGSNLALAVVGATLAYDAGAFIMGNGRGALGGPVGVIAGMVTVTVVAVFVAAVMNPPFSGARPWVIFAGIALAAPLGVRLCEWPARGERLPAVRRLDSLSLVAPLWVAVVALVLHR